MGCAKTFSKHLHSRRGNCPQNLWPNVMRQARIRMSYMRPSVSLLNLIYHVYPSKQNRIWRANVARVANRINIFNGQRIVAVAVDDSTYGIDEVRREFGSADVELLELENDRELREAATLPILLERVASTEEHEASFFAHTKGNTARDNRLGAELWRNAMYHALLDNVNVCRDLLLRHPCVGTHKMCWPEGLAPYPNRFDYGRWMFAGTFWWIRHRDVFSQPHWRDVPRDRYGAEAWLSGLFDADAAASVFQPWPANEYPTPSPYDPALYLYPIRDA